MKCLNKKFFALFAAVTLIFTGCGKEKIYLEYGEANLPQNYTIDDVSVKSEADLFAKNLCAVKDNVIDSSSIDASSVYSAGIFSVNDCNTLYAYNVNDKVNPASITKILTALIVIENCNLDDIVIVPDVTINEEGAQLFGLKEGDKITVRNLLYVSLVYSGNDASLCLAKYVAGSSEEFAKMMNDKAKELGATNSHFVNPHGLSHDDHYTTAYDLYLIFNECTKHQEFLDIVNSSSYVVSYTTAEGETKEREIHTTNKFLSGDYACDGNVTIWGGKTGSTSAAGKCIILYAYDGSNNPYICVIMGANNEESLYNSMKQLCDETIR